MNSPKITLIVEQTCGTITETFDGKKVRAKRKEKGITQRKLAEVMGVTEETIRNWERGNSEPLYHQGVRLIEILGIDDYRKISIKIENEVDKEIVTQDMRKIADQMLSKATDEE